jgi:Rab3 GTPase-activating protein catalytic subunit
MLYKVLFFVPDVEFIVTRYNLRLKPLEDVISPIEEEADEGRPQALQDMMSLDNDFPPETKCDYGDGSPHPHPLVRWYGLRDFVVVTPAHDMSGVSRMKILLSSIYMAINNSNW